MPKPTVLVVDDDPHIRQIVLFALEKAGFGAFEAADGLEALRRFDEITPDLVVLDVLMPEMDGTDVCRELRKKAAVPIVFLSSKDEEIDRVLGLELGGDDYIGKPFSPRELVARIKAVLRRGGSSPGEAAEGRRGGGEAAAGRELRHGALALDLDRFKAWWGEQEVELTVTEFNLVRTMLGFPGKVFTRDQLMSGAYDGHIVVSDRTIDSHIRRVRRKFADAGGQPIETVHGLGYKLGACRPSP